MFKKKKGKKSSILCTIFANLLTKDIIYCKCHDRKQKSLFIEDAQHLINRFSGIHLSAEERKAQITETGKWYSMADNKTFVYMSIVIT